MEKEQKPKRKSIRLKEYDYSTPGYYFVTICTKDRKCLFSEITEQGMELNDVGKMIDTIWNEIPAFYPNVSVDEFVIMPNHVHGIIIINSPDNVGGGPCASPQDSGQTNGHPQGGAPTNQDFSLSDIVHRFKSLTTHNYIKGVKQNNWKLFNDKIWQRNYYEHVIRNDIDLSETREYIINNPKKWHLDRNNPANFETQGTSKNV